MEQKNIHFTVKVLINASLDGKKKCTPIFYAYKMFKNETASLLISTFLKADNFHLSDLSYYGLPISKKTSEMQQLNWMNPLDDMHTNPTWYV